MGIGSEFTDLGSLFLLHSCLKEPTKPAGLKSSHHLLSSILTPSLRFCSHGHHLTFHNEICILSFSAGSRIFCFSS